MLRSRGTTTDERRKTKDDRQKTTDRRKTADNRNSWKIYILRFIFAILLGFITISCGDVARCTFLSDDEVCITVINQSGRPIDLVTLDPGFPEAKMRDIDVESQASIAVEFKQSAECWLTASFNDDESSESAKVRVKGGMRLNAIVLTDTIVFLKRY